MALAFIGLLASAALYLLAIYGIAWSWSRRVGVGEGHGVAVEAQSLTIPTTSEIWRRHSVEWTVGFAIFFIALAMANFPLWQRLCIMGALAIVFGSTWFAQGEPGGLAEATPRLRRMGSSIWYWLLAVGDWLGYLGILCFAAELLVKPL